jgi:hypothetical protein
MKHLSNFGTWSRVNEAEELGEIDSPMDSPAPEAGGPSTASAAVYTIGGKSYTLNQIVIWVDASITEAMKMVRDPEQGLIAEIEAEQAEGLAEIDNFVKRKAIQLAMGTVKTLAGFEKNINLLINSIESALRAKRSEIAQAVGEQDGKKLAAIYAEATKTAVSSFWKAAGSVLKGAIKKAVGLSAEVKKANPKALTVEDRITQYRLKVRRLFINQLLTLGVSKVNMPKIYAEINKDGGLFRKKLQIEKGLKNSVTTGWIDSFRSEMDAVHGPGLDAYIKQTLGADTLKGEKMAAIEQPSGEQDSASAVA